MLEKKIHGVRYRIEDPRTARAKRYKLPAIFEVWVFSPPDEAWIFHGHFRAKSLRYLIDILTDPEGVRK